MNGPNDIIASIEKIADASNQQRETDQQVYPLSGLALEEIKIVEATGTEH